MATSAPPDTMTSPEIMSEILARLARVEAQLAELVSAWRSYQDVAEAYARGGILGARTATRRRRRVNGDST